MDTMDTWQVAPAVLQTHCRPTDRPTDRRSLNTKTTPNQPGILKEPSDHSRCQRPCVCQWTPHLDGNPPTLPADKKPSGPELRDAVVKEGDAVKSSCGITSFVKLTGLEETL
jgi:hypothetical protein